MVRAAQLLAPLSSPAVDLLVNPVWHTLDGPQSDVAEAHRTARRFLSDVAVFGAVPDEPDDDDWDALRTLVGPGGSLPVAGAGHAARQLGVGFRNRRRADDHTATTRHTQPEHRSSTWPPTSPT